MIISEILTSQIQNLDYSTIISNSNLNKPSLFAVNVIFTHFFLFISFKICTKHYKDKISIRVIFPLLVHLKTLLLHIQQLNVVISSENFASFIYSILFTKVILIILYWIIVLSIYFCLEYNYLSSLKTKLIIKRKFFHFLAFLIFFPGVRYVPNEIMKTIVLIVIYFSFIIEIIRNSSASKKIKILQKLSTYLQNNIDERDDDKLILTHIFLLFGISSSLFYSFTNIKYHFLGNLILGVGDSMCSIIGVRFGKTKIYPYNNRTLEGTIGGYLFTLFFFCLLSVNVPSAKDVFSFGLIFLYEGMTLQIDNLVLPLFGNNIFKLFH